jgi:hypothetical protein
MSRVMEDYWHRRCVLLSRATTDEQHKLLLLRAAAVLNELAHRRASSIRGDRSSRVSPDTQVGARATSGSRVPATLLGGCVNHRGLAHMSPVHRGKFVAYYRRSTDRQGQVRHQLGGAADCCPELPERRDRLQAPASPACYRPLARAASAGIAVARRPDKQDRAAAVAALNSGRDKCKSKFPGR